MNCLDLLNYFAKLNLKTIVNILLMIHYHSFYSYVMGFQLGWLISVSST